MTNIETEDVRWDVELTTGEFHDVGAASLHIEDGCLVFRDTGGFLLVAYAAGYWRAVSGQMGSLESAHATPLPQMETDK